MMRALALSVALAGCSSPATSTLDLSVARPCASGTAPLARFETAGNPFGVCKPTYAAERAAVSCALFDVRLLTCNDTVDLVESASVASVLQCFYDHTTGALVDAWGFVDTAGSCGVGGAHLQCPDAHAVSICTPDGGP
jgi:hypothetical protein